MKFLLRSRPLAVLLGVCLVAWVSTGAALATDPSVDLILDQGEGAPAAVPSFDSYSTASATGSAAITDSGGRFQLATVSSAGSWAGVAVGGAAAFGTAAFRYGPELLKTGGESPNPAALGLAVLVVGAQVVFSHEEEVGPEIEFGTPEERRLEREGQLEWFIRANLEQPPSSPVDPPVDPDEVPTEVNPRPWTAPSSPSTPEEPLWPSPDEDVSCLDSPLWFMDCPQPTYTGSPGVGDDPAGIVVFYATGEGEPPAEPPSTEPPSVASPAEESAAPESGANAPGSSVPEAAAAPPPPGGVAGRERKERERALVQAAIDAAQTGAVVGAEGDDVGIAITAGAAPPAPPADSETAAKAGAERAARAHVDALALDDFLALRGAFNGQERPDGGKNPSDEVKAAQRAHDASRDAIEVRWKGHIIELGVAAERGIESVEAFIDQLRDQKKLVWVAAMSFDPIITPAEKLVIQEAVRSRWLLTPWSSDWGLVPPTPGPDGSETTSLFPGFTQPGSIPGI